MNMFKVTPKKCVLIAIGATAGLAVARQTCAAEIFSYQPAQTTLSASAGASLSLSLYLKDSATSAMLLTSESGLSQAGVAINFASKTGTGTATTLTGLTQNTTDFAGTATFGFPATVTPTSVTGDLEVVALGSQSGVKLGNTGGGVSPSTPANEVFLGVLQMTAGAAGTSTTFNIGAVDPTNGQYTLSFNNGYDIDVPANNGGGPSYTGVGSSFSQFVVNVASAPEPGSMGLMCIGGLGILRRRVRRIS